MVIKERLIKKKRTDQTDDLAGHLTGWTTIPPAGPLFRRLDDYYAGWLLVFRRLIIFAVRRFWPWSPLIVVVTLDGLAVRAIIEVHPRQVGQMRHYRSSPWLEIITHLCFNSIQFNKVFP